MTRTPRLPRLVAPAVAAVIAAAATMILVGRTPARAHPRDARQEQAGGTTEKQVSRTPIQAHPQDAGRVVPGGATARIDPGATRPPAPGQMPSPSLRRMHFRQMDVVTVGQRVAVTGAAEVYETVPGNLYVWLLRIYSGDDQKPLLKEHHYANRAVIVPQGVDTMSPTFEDAFELPPGVYKVELTIYCVAPGFPFDKLQYGEEMRKATLTKLSRFRKITIGN